jgi:hypothetical protein
MTLSTRLFTHMKGVYLISDLGNPVVVTGSLNPNVRAKLNTVAQAHGAMSRASAMMRVCYSPKASLCIGTEGSRGALGPDSRVHLELKTRLICGALGIR